jgi:hypothetical protein
LMGSEPRRALSVLKDRVLLPVHRTRLQCERRRSRRNDALLPIALTRTAAATPSLQDEG